MIVLGSLDILCPPMSYRKNIIFKNIINQRQITLLSERPIWTDKCRHKSWDQNQSNRKLPTANGSKAQTNYDILGISPKANQKDIKSAYYSLSKTCHPDVNTSSEAALQFRVITDAYEVLSNKESKRNYDLKIGIHYSERKTINNSQVNQQNLDRYQEFRLKNKSEQKFSDTEEYNYQKWKKRRNFKMENMYRKQTEEANKDRHAYKDPLNYETSKEFFTEHFNEEMQKRYAEQIDKMAEEMYKKQEEYNKTVAPTILLVLGIMTIPLVVHLIGNLWNLNESQPKVNQNKNVNNSKE